MKKVKSIPTIILAMMAALLMASCDGNGYEPISSSPDACQVIVQCVDRSGKTLLDDRKFADAISVEGGASHSKIRYDVRNYGSGKALFFNAELPDQGDMKWSADRHEANGISRMTMKFNKHKVEMKCHIKYVANRPRPLPAEKPLLKKSHATIRPSNAPATASS